MSGAEASGLMLIFAKAMNGKILRVKASPNSTVAEVKEAMRRENPRHLQSASFRLISRARVLAEKKTLKELGIVSQQMLSLVEIERVTISDPNSPVNDPGDRSAGVAPETAARIKAVDPTPPAAPAPKREQPAAQPPPAASAKATASSLAPPHVAPSDSFLKVVRTASKVLPGEEEKSFFASTSPTAALAGAKSNSIRASSSPQAALAPAKSSPDEKKSNAMAEHSKPRVPQMMPGGDSFHKIVRTASKILPQEEVLGVSPTGTRTASTELNGFQRVPSAKPVAIREEGDGSGEEEVAPGSKGNGAESQEDGKDQEDVFQTAMAALSEVVGVMEGVKGTVAAAAKKLETLEASVVRVDSLAKRVAAAEARLAAGGPSAKEELIGSLVQRLGRLERALNSP